MQPKEALAVLIAAFRQEKIEPETAAIYVKQLRDIPGAVLEETVAHILCKSRFFPTIAEIRETSARLCGLLPVSPQEALAIVKQADVAIPKYDRAGRYCYTEREWVWPDHMTSTTIAAIHRTLQAVGDPYGGDGKAKFGWEQSFAKCYEAKAEECTRDVLADLRTFALPAKQRKAVTDGR